MLVLRFKIGLDFHFGFIWMVFGYDLADGKRLKQQ
jgi:hypothetical protein